jgi:hypothetical protein
MAMLTRRSVLFSSLALGATSVLARPYIANAAASTAAVWWTQGSAEEEDISFKKIVAEYEKASGNTIDYSIMPYAPLRQKIVSAVTSASSRICSRTTRPRSLRSTPGRTSWSTSATSSRRNGRNTPKPRCSRSAVTRGFAGRGCSVNGPEVAGSDRSGYRKLELF